MSVSAQITYRHINKYFTEPGDGMSRLVAEVRVLTAVLVGGRRPHGTSSYSHQKGELQAWSF